MLKLFCSLVALGTALAGASAAAADSALNTYPRLEAKKPVTLHFRRDVTIAWLDKAYPVGISADNRGPRVPARPEREELSELSLHPPRTPL